MESIGFKEWSLVCDALGRGEQSIVLRKGGIAEGRDGFSFRYREFFLFPTFFHEQTGKVRTPATDLQDASGGKIVISLCAKVGRAVRIDSLGTAEALAPLHVLTPEVVRERFGYEGDGLNVAFVRVFRLKPDWIFPNENRFGGCKSWVELPSPPLDLKLEAVLDQAIHAERLAQFDKIAAT